MLHFEYEGFIIDIPEKIIAVDSRYPWCYNKILTLYLSPPVQGYEEVAFRIKEFRNDWFWVEEIADLQYLDYERVKNLKAFL